MIADEQGHWDQVYKNKAPTAVSWFHVLAAIGSFEGVACCSGSPESFVE